MVSIVTKSYRKNILRDLRTNLSRFISLFGIVLLGVMMLTGLVSFAPSMRRAGDEYFAMQNVFDLRVLSTLGLSQEDIVSSRKLLALAMVGYNQLIIFLPAVHSLIQYFHMENGKLLLDYLRVDQFSSFVQASFPAI